jgi:hypothetical protein
MIINITAIGVDVGCHLGPQHRRQHLPSTVADDLIHHRRAGLVGDRTFLDYLSMKAYLPEPARQRRS